MMFRWFCSILGILPSGQYASKMLNMHCVLPRRRLLFHSMLLVVVSHHLLPCSSVVLYVVRVVVDFE